MFCNLLSHFDLWLGGFTILSFIFNGFSSVLCPIFFLSNCGVFMKGGRVEAFVSKVMISFTNASQGQRVVSFSGSYHVTSSLFMFLLMLNMMGSIPYLNSLTLHFVSVFSLSLPFWFAFSSCVFPQNFKYYFGEAFSGDHPMVITWMLLMTELLSVLARPFTLAFRLCVNVIIEQMVLSILGGKVGYWLVSAAWWVPGYLFKGVLFTFLCSFMVMVEMGVLLIHSSIFVILLISYSGDGVLSK